MPPPSALLTVV
jgi:hypothetical protein